jgi:hypothetical protein
MKERSYRVYVAKIRPSNFTRTEEVYAKLENITDWRLRIWKTFYLKRGIGLDINILFRDNEQGELRRTLVKLYEIAK